MARKDRVSIIDYLTGSREDGKRFLFRCFLKDEKNIPNHVAVDFVILSKDIALFEMNMKALRFSIVWSRIFPER